MRRLIWKELREVGWWAAAMISAPCLLVALGYPLWCRGEGLSGVFGLLPIGAFLLGAVSYSRELAWDSVRFTYSRPIRWWHLWLVKFGVGVVVCVLSAAIPTIIYRLTCPDIYLPFAALTRLAEGAGMVLSLTGILFICGFGCSAVAPGLSWTVGIAGASLLFVLLLGQVEYGALHREGFYFVMGTPVVMVIASLLLARRLTHPLSARVRRYTIVFNIGMYLSLFLALLLPGRRPRIQVTQISPDRKTVAMIVVKPVDKGEETNLLKLQPVQGHRATTIENADNIACIGWSPDSTAFLYLVQPKGTQTTFLKSVEPVSCRKRALAKLPMQCRELDSDSPEENRGTWSPSGRRFAFSVYTLNHKARESVTMHGLVLDLPSRTLYKLPLNVELNEYLPAWWLSDDEIATATGSTGVLTGTVIAVNVKTGKTRTLIGEKTSPPVRGNTN